MGARRQTLYVSSTFEDLKDHRAAVKASLEKAGFDVESMEREEPERHREQVQDPQTRIETAPGGHGLLA